MHELKVSPVPGQTEMIIAQSDAPLAAGRYALVLNGQDMNSRWRARKMRRNFVSKALKPRLEPYSPSVRPLKRRQEKFLLRVD